MSYIRLGVGVKTYIQGCCYQPSGFMNEALIVQLNSVVLVTI